MDTGDGPGAMGAGDGLGAMGAGAAPPGAGDRQGNWVQPGLEIGAAGAEAGVGGIIA